MNNGFNIDKAEIDNIFRIYQQRKTNQFSSGSTGGVTDDFKMIEPNPTNGQYIRREQGWDGFTEM